MTPSIVNVAFCADRGSNTRRSCSAKELNVTVELTAARLFSSLPLPSPVAIVPAAKVVVAVVTLELPVVAVSIADSILVAKVTRVSLEVTSTEIPNFSPKVDVKSKVSVPAPPVPSPLTVKTLLDKSTPNAFMSVLPLFILLRLVRLNAVDAAEAADRNCVSPVVEVIVREFCVPVSDLINNRKPLPVSMISAPTPATSFKVFFRPSMELLLLLTTTS